jgi:anaerobic nitric oxide reductase transcription regulator
MSDLQALLAIAADLTSSLAAQDRYDRLLAAVREVIPCDAASLMRLDGDELVPLASYGLAPEALGKRYLRREHPRLEMIVRSNEPVRFAPDSPLPDPFDGLLAADPSALRQIHACLGCPLHEAGEVVGVLTVDALEPGRFDRLDQEFLATLGALAGAALRTTALIEVSERLAEHRGLVVRELGREASRRSGGEILGNSAGIERVRQEIELVGRSDLTVLIQGETGVGKELCAHAIHAASRRSDQPLIMVNCAALPESVAESELFGHLRGAFTGAGSDRAGKFEVADGGTLLLDEVGELPPAVQPKLLRVLQSGELQRVGSDRLKRVDVRVLAATNRNLRDEVAAGRFRIDLYHRLNGFVLTVPPLRDRRDDVPLLAGYFLDRFRRNLGLGPVRLTQEARRALTSAPWPGNVRELENALGRAVLRAGGDSSGSQKPVIVEPRHLELEATELPLDCPEPVETSPQVLAPGQTLNQAVDAYKRQLIERVVEEAKGNWSVAAQSLGMHRSNLHHLAKRLGLR